MSVDQPTDRPADEAAVRALLARQNEAWAAGDADAYAALFTPDADYVTWIGTHLRGRGAIAESHRPLFEKHMKGTRIDSEITGIRFLTPDVAIAHSLGAVVGGRKRRTRRNTKVQTTVAVRHDGEWLLTAFQNGKYHWLTEALTSRLTGGRPRPRRRTEPRPPFFTGR
ncbi:MAG TPA: SgcJ/EcaC family oxidoreductase [Nocardia sp.]|uniref:SgcJ/EcaC family oxidoreductase n=1 Tax=Nocardia sp. TaxID=1821 RepID=UPI002B4B6BE4|nr:SgcJ/EcaC family oxidoreductase [Nocardia sp.]HLS77917.1 SgcJ/EcaC family oxidoreductase [Nocardia sp.]